MSNLSPKTIGAIVAAVLVLLAVLFFVWKLTLTPKVPQKANIAITAADHAKGNKKAAAILVEYSDLQCPACKAYYPVVKAVFEKNKDKMYFVYRHFPINQHQYAFPAARAAEAAARQGKFWEMHDLLFEKQEDWSKTKNIDAQLLRYAKKLKLDEKKFTSDYDSTAVKNKVVKDQESGVQFTVNSTPTFFLNGVQLDPAPQSIAEFEALITKTTP